MTIKQTLSSILLIFPIFAHASSFPARELPDNFEIICDYSKQLNMVFVRQGNELYKGLNLKSLRIHPVKLEPWLVQNSYKTKMNSSSKTEIVGGYNISVKHAQNTPDKRRYAKIRINNDMTVRVGYASVDLKKDEGTGVTSDYENCQWDF